MAQRLWLAGAVFLVSLAGCRPAEHDDASGTIAPWAANAAEVARFEDEVPFGPGATVGKDKTPVRKSPGSPDLVATLPVGTEVVKLSSRGLEDLVCFDEPKPGSRHLMGWVAESFLQDATPPPPAPVPTPSTEDGGATPPAPPDPPPHGGHHHHPHRPRRQ